MRAGWLAALMFSGCALAQPAKVSTERLALCGACHGEQGVSRIPGTPSLAAQPSLFIENQLVLIREGVREVAAPMAEAVQGMRDAEIRALAKHYAALRPPPPADAPDPALARRARAVADKAYCGSCHLPDYSGRDQIPRLAGQREEYLLESMRAYVENRRPGGDTIMAASLYGIADADLQALAKYLAGKP
ncbi:MAG TPA: c-type cytochrome [Burkholderiales bacterium]|nr:c-type cytochrome [Burkholderiales bacterium]